MSDGPEGRIILTVALNERISQLGVDALKLTLEMNELVVGVTTEVIRKHEVYMAQADIGRELRTNLMEIVAALAHPYTTQQEELNAKLLGLLDQHRRETKSG